MTGGLLQLAAYGEQDLFLTGSPQMTYFVAVYKRHTNFAIESVQRYFHGEPAFGKRIHLDVDRVGDLVHEMHLDLLLPNLNERPEENPDYVVSWVNSIGHAIIEKIDLEIGGVIVDTQYGQWLEIWNELTIDAEKRDGYNYLTGKHEFFTPASQPGPLHLHIPLQFWFNRNIGLSLPLIALQHSMVRVIIEFRRFEQLWVSNTGGPPGCGGEDSSIMTETDIIEGSMFIDYIFLETDERRRFANNCHEILIEQTQQHVEEFSGMGNERHFHLNFIHPVKELIWVIQDYDHIEQRKDWFNFSNLCVPAGNTMIGATLYFEGRERFKIRDADHFRLVQPLQRHKNVPNNFIYVYSFAHDPESYQPSGTANFSRIDHPSFHITIDPTVHHPHVTIYARNYNILKIKDGAVGLLFID